MQSLIKTLLLLCLFLPSAFCQTEAKPWDYYRTILGTGMFPQAPKINDTIMVTKAPVAPVKRWELDYKVHMVYQHIKSGDAIIGVQNIKGDAPSFNLRVGERHEPEGVRLQDVDLDGKRTVVTLEKDDRAQCPGCAQSASLPYPSQESPVSARGTLTAGGLQ